MPKEKETSSDQLSNDKSNAPKGDILVLLVGIDNYAQIRDLSGCINDLNRMESFLKKRFLSASTANGKKEGVLTTYTILEGEYANLKIYRLENEQATYLNIIHAFRTFLRPAGMADKVWFHFSGHGTEAPTATNFRFLENNKDQCLMCHDCFANHSTGVHGNMLADKEIAVLLEEVAMGENGTPHIVVTIDCCHSGGLTRDAEDDVTIRNIEMPENAKQRDLASYLDGHYSKMSEIVVPKTPHTVLTACSNMELAGEKNGGFFTNGLVDTLERVGGKISYSDLLIHARHAVKQKRANQTPQFEVIGGAKSYARFLEGTPENSKDKYEVYFEDGWRIRCGRIQGLPTKNELNEIVKAGGQVEIEIHSTNQPNLIAAKANIRDVGPQFSTLIITEGSLQTDEIVYFGVFDYFPARPTYVLVNLPIITKNALFDAAKAAGIKKAQHIYLLSASNETTPHQLIISTENNQYLLTDLVTNQQRHLLDNDALFDALVKVTNFHRLLALKNESTTLLDKADLTIDMLGRGDRPAIGVEKIGPFGKELLITADLVNSLQGDHADNRQFNLYPKVSIKNSREILYVYLYSLWSDYAIEVEEEKKSTGLIEYTKFGSWGLDPGESESTVYLKLIVSPDPFDSHQLLQDGIEAIASRGRSRGVVIKSGTTFKDWCAITLKITVVRG